MRYSRDLRQRQPSGQRTLTQRAISILARYGTDASLFLPGVGAVNGIQAGNWLDSAGTVPAAANDPVGLAANARSVLGPELRNVGTVSSLGTSAIATYNPSTGSGIAYRVDVANQSGVRFAAKLGSLHLVSITVASGLIHLRNGDIFDVIFGVNLGVGTHHVYGFANLYGGQGSVAGISVSAATASAAFTVNSIRDLPGAHATQPTTANKPILRQASGFFSWQFDGGNDSFATTMAPANAGFICTSANVSGAGTVRTLLGAGAGSDASSGVWLARQANNALTLTVGNGTTRNSVAAAYPVSSAAVASAGWDAGSMLVGVNNTESAGTKTVNCASANTANIGVLTGTTHPMLGSMGPLIVINNALPNASERAVLRRFVASLSGVLL